MEKQITSDRRRQLAEKHGVNEQYLYQCLTGRRDLNPAEAMRLELESKGELTRQSLCQKTYASIWPNLKPRIGNEERRTGPVDRRVKAA
jgi:DNA-binding transcriptional regulator YdaS (Cro superfamily)